MRSHLSASLRHIGRELIGAFALVMIAVVIFIAFNTEARTTRNDSEAKFADLSVSGLAIVPASCPSSPHYTGQCTPLYLCPNGLPMTIYPTCVCPPGYHVQVGPTVSTCEPDPTPPPPPGCQGSGCPQCVAGAGGGCASAPNICGMIGSGVVQCNGSCSAATPSNNLCPVTCWDGSVVTGGLESCPACPEGWTKVGASCVPPPSPNFESFTIIPAPSTGSAIASGHLEARPALVRQGNTTRLFWKVINVRSCTVTGSNGDRWTTTFSGASGVVSSPLTSRTTFTLHCLALIGATPTSITETKTVNIVPVWFEE